MKTFKQFIAESMGVNINDDAAPWTEWILSGKKTVETRNSPTLHKYMGDTVGIIRTGKKRKATMIGFMDLSVEGILYINQHTNREHKVGDVVPITKAGRTRNYVVKDFDADVRHHCVCSDAAFCGDEIRYGYTTTNVRKCEPVQINSLGIVARQIGA